MGAGGSIDSGLALETDSDRYFCHGCHRVFPLGHGHSPIGASCPYCFCETLEELSSISRGQNLWPVRRNSRGRFANMFGNHEVTDSQTQRATTAATMLRLLESQLREELEQLQFAFETAHLRLGAELRNASASQLAEKTKFSKIMLGKLRTCKLDVDSVCSQPSCPICSEDFAVDNCETKLPCSHIFHRACVVPWLEMKQNCPICRTCLTDEIPSLLELEKLSTQDLTQWLDLLRNDEAKSGEKASSRSEQKNCEYSESAEKDGIATVSAELDGAKETDDSTSDRSAIAARLHQELYDYQRDVIATEAATERRQQQDNARSFLAHNARLQEQLDGQLREYLHLSPGQSERLLMTNDPESNMSISRTRSSPLSGRERGSVGDAGEAPTSPGISGALRRGFYSSGSPIATTGNPSSSSSAAAASALMFAGMNAAGNGGSRSNSSSFNSSSNAPPYPTIIGSTRLGGGYQLHHRIRVVDDDHHAAQGDEEEGGDDAADERSDDEGTGNTNSDMDRLYQAANESHLARFGVGGMLGGLGEISNSWRPRRDDEIDERAPAFLRSTTQERSEQSSISAAELINSITNELNVSNFAHQADWERTREREREMEREREIRSSELSNLTSGAISSAISNTSHASQASSASMALSEAEEALIEANRARAMGLSAVDRYLALNTSSRSAVHENNTSIRTADTEESVPPARFIGTTYQVRSTGSGTYSTIPVTFSGSQSRPIDND